MLEKYVENFDEERVIAFMQNTEKGSRTEALQRLRQLVPKESYFQEKVMKALKEKYPAAFIRKISLGAYSQAGFPDVLMIFHGKYYGFEIKRPVIGKPTKLQLETISKIRQAGGIAEIVRWPEEAIAMVEENEGRN